MKKVLNKISMLFCILSICLFFIPSNVSAYSTSYISIEETKDFDFDDILLKNVKFVDNSNTTTKGFGLKGTVINDSGLDLQLEVLVDYYNSSYNKVTSSEYNQIIPARGEYDYLQIAESENVSVNEIKYYTLNANVRTNTFKTHSPHASKNGYYIDSYQVNIKVNENNTLDIIEKIKVNYTTKKHGIIRVIPLRNQVIRDDDYSKTIARISDVSVIGAEYQTSKNGSDYEIKIGSSSKYEEGMKEYTISYKYNLGKENNKGFDELYFNIIGSDWDTYVGNVKFNIEMPKEFDSSKMGLSSDGDSEIFYLVKGKTITGRYNGVLDESEALTIRIEMEDDYFKGDRDGNTFILILMYAIPLLCLGLCIVFWSIHGKDDPVVEPVEFYPPENLNSLEVAYIYKKKAEENDVVSLLVYLASKGYLKIEEITKKGLFGRETTTFKIIKVKDYDGNNIHEKVFFRELFLRGGKNKDGASIVTEDDLEYSFYSVINQILNKVNNKKNKDKIYDTTTKKYSIIGLGMLIVTFLIVTLPTCIYIGISPFVILFGIFGMIPFFFLGKTNYVYMNGLPIRSKILPKIILIIVGCAFLFTPIITIAIELQYAPTFKLPLMIGLACCVGILICLKYMEKRSDYGTKIYGKVLGFKRFLETAEKGRLETLVEENPTYFYDILPYTYVLGVSNVWMEKFESITIDPPDWYLCAHSFHMHHFNRFMNNSMNRASKTMTSTPTSMPSSSGGSSSGGGRFSGGGFSGGGSGGGGGRSW